MKGQVPVEIYVPWEVLEQILFAAVGDIVMGNINAFVVCPVIIPFDFSQHWYCIISNSTIYLCDTVYGKHTNEGWIRTAVYNQDVICLTVFKVMPLPGTSLLSILWVGFRCRMC